MLRAKDAMDRAFAEPLCVPRLARIVAVPMILHGLYDTLLKKEMSVLALVVAVASFFWLAWQISRLRTLEPEMAA